MQGIFSSNKRLTKLKLQIKNKEESFKRKQSQEDQ